MPMGPIFASKEICNLSGRIKDPGNQTRIPAEIYGTSTDSSSLQGRLPVAGHRISPFGAYPNARSRQTGVILESIDECNPLCHDLNPKNPRVIPVNINLASEKGHRQLTRKTLINITKQLTAIIIRCKENHCMNDFSGLCLNRSFNFTGCKDRSEEHTSELQSLMRISYAVFCLKKKKNNTKQSTRAMYTTILIRTTKYEQYIN